MFFTSFDTNYGLFLDNSLRIMGRSVGVKEGHILPLLFSWLSGHTTLLVYFTTLICRSCLRQVSREIYLKPCLIRTLFTIDIHVSNYDYF